MNMFSRKVFMCIIITLEVIICQKDSDEGRPYEFGFTIDGQQHRHEKKDQNGIIQGEFGFITADGVYHVTVYATDENGDFKILSMRNIRISAPLDGSPALGPISPEASKYLKKANLPNQVEPAKPLPIALQKSEKLQEAPPLTVTQKSIVSTQRAPYVFTTQSTIRPACGGCGLIATAKPGTKFTFQNPAFKDTVQNPQQNGKITGIQNRFSDIPSDTELLPPGYNNNIVPSPGKKLPQSFNPGSVSSSEFPQSKGQVYTSSSVPATGEKSSQTFDNINGPQQKFGPAQNGQFQQGNINTQSQNVEDPTVQSLSRPANSFSTSNDKALGGISSFGTVPASNVVDNKSPGGSQPFEGQQSGAVSGAGPNLSVESVAGKTDKLSRDRFGKLLAPSISSNGPNPLLRSQDIDKLPPVMVSDNVIHVMGKKPMDIPIKDKYPGMVDGLPKGVEVKDVTNILYKFKYTVGFHGHYEMGLKDGSKVGGYFVNGRDGISRVVTYVADENGFRPKFKFINLGLDSPDTPNENTEKTFGLKDFEFVWYPVH